MTRRTAIVLIAAVAATLLGTAAFAVAQIFDGNDEHAPAASTPAAAPTSSEGHAPEPTDEPVEQIDVDGVPVRLQNATATPERVEQARATITWTQLYNTRDCTAHPYPGFDVAAVTDMTTGVLAEDLTYQRYDWEHPRSSDTEACTAGPPILASVTGATLPESIDGKQKVIVTYLTDTGGQLDSTTVGYTLAEDGGRWKLAELDENPALHN